MKVTVRTVDGGDVTIKDMDLDTIQPMIEALSDETVRVLALQLDEAMTYIMKSSIVRVDVDTDR